MSYTQAKACGYHQNGITTQFLWGEGWGEGGEKDGKEPQVREPHETIWDTGSC